MPSTLASEPPPLKLTTPRSGSPGRTVALVSTVSTSTPAPNAAISLRNTMEFSL